MPRMHQLPDNCAKHVLVDSTNDIKLQILAANLKKQMAKDVPFTENYCISKPLGKFQVGDSVKDLSISQILIKLLGLTLDTESPELPDTPEIEVPTTNPVVEDIITNKKSIYQLDNNLDFIELPYKLITFTPEEYAKKPETNISGFYSKQNESGVIDEYGYQHCTDLMEMYYAVFLPSSFKLGENVIVSTWSDVDNCWLDISSNLTSDRTAINTAFEEVGLAAPIEIQDYTLWADLTNIDPGSKYRFKLKETI